jgi:hypothetical protein
MLDCKLKISGSFCNLCSFPSIVTRMPNYKLWEHAIAILFCRSAKQTLSPLEWSKYLDHG